MKINNTGYTLIELLIVVIIIGILSAITLPSFLNQTSKARETEPIQNLKYILNRQQEYYQENGGRFASTWDELSTGLPQESSSYNYSLFEAEQSTGVIINSRNEDLNSFLGGIKATNIRGQPKFLVIQCRSIKRGDILKPESLLIGKNQVLCGKRVDAIK